MLSRVHTCALFGIESFIIDVESDVSAGLAAFDIVGLGDTAVKESKERIKASILYWRYLCFNRNGYENIPLLSIVFLPLGFLVYLLDLCRGK